MPAIVSDEEGSVIESGLAMIAGAKVELDAPDLARDAAARALIDRLALEL